MNTDSFYCLRCETIPLIELAPKENELKILATCQCHRQLLKSKAFFKNYYNPDKIQVKTKEQDDNNQNNINKLINSYQEYKDKFNHNSNRIKQEAINIYKNAIQKIEQAFEINKKINEKIDKIIQILINAYNHNSIELINKKNIVLNLQINTNINIGRLNYDYISSTVNTMVNYFQNNYIIMSKSFQMTNSFNNTNEIIEINKDLFAIKFQDKYIKIMKSKNNNKWISLKTEIEIKKLLIDRINNLLISVDKQQLIKFWDISEIEKRFNDSTENQFVNIIPLYEFKHENNISELIVMENNILCGSGEANLFLYKYDINQKIHNLMKKIHVSNALTKLTEIKRKNKNYLCCKDDNYLVFLNIPQLTEINRIKIGNWKNELCHYEQIFENEIIIGIDRCLKILNLDTFEITLSKKINMEIRCIKKLKDTSILVGGRKIIKRFSIQTMEELPQLIIFDQGNSDSDEDYGIGPGVIDLKKDVQRIKELSNGNIMLFLKHDINIYGLNIDS